MVSFTTSNYEKQAYDGLMNHDDNSGGAKYNSRINSSHEILLFQLHVLFDSWWDVIRIKKIMPQKCENKNCDKNKNVREL